MLSLYPYIISLILAIILQIFPDFLLYYLIILCFCYNSPNISYLSLYSHIISWIAAIILQIFHVFYVSAIIMSLFTWRTKKFLFFLYSNISAYIAFTYLFFTLITSTNDGYLLLIYYFPFSCIGYIVFLVNKKSHFAHD